jgi:hypothetical protein
VAIVCAALVLVVRVALADTGERAARRHHADGKRLYEAGEYRLAIGEFEAGYRASARAEFLVNLGQCYRRLDELTKAREMYLRFLADVPADDPLRAQVAELIAEIDRTEAERAQAPPARPVPPPEQVARTAVLPAPSPALDVRARRPSRSSRRSPYVPLVAVAAAAVLVAGITTLVVLSADDPLACSDAELGCVDRR